MASTLSRGGGTRTIAARAGCGCKPSAKSGECCSGKACGCHKSGEACSAS